MEKQEALAIIQRKIKQIREKMAAAEETEQSGAMIRAYLCQCRKDLEVLEIAAEALTPEDDRTVRLDLPPLPPQKGD